MKIFCERLTELRKQFNYTQRHMANLIGIAQPSYIRYEIGNSEPTLENLCKIADIFSVSIDYLLGRVEI